MKSEKPTKKTPESKESVLVSIFDAIDVNSPEFDPPNSARWADAAWRAFDRGREYLRSRAGEIGTLSIGAIGKPETLCATIKSLQEILSREMPDIDQLTADELDNITPKQAAIYSIDTAVFMLAHEIEHDKEFTARTLSIALGIGAALMRLAIENPESEIAAKLDKWLGIDFSKEAERGLERVIRKREKKRQDKRKSSVESKRNESAIAMMKKLVPEHGPLNASKIVVERMNRRRKVLDVDSETVRRWYYTRIEKDRKARESARLGRSPS